VPTAALPRCLKYHGLQHWAPAGRRLAKLHAAFADRAAELARSDFLLALDRAYFGAWADRARAAAGVASAALGNRLERVLGRHREVAGLLAAQPPTLVHNDLAPKNVIADTSTDPARICFVDWEMAGVGCGLLDLAHLMHGLSARDERLLCTAYRGEPGAGRLALPDPEFARVLAACKLQNTLFRLAHIEAWDVGRETAALWVEDVARLQAAI
jgi:aminoglycoside phosphotransferase (APT) family kinase protein